MKPSKVNRPERQHYITKGYLDGFTLEGLCVVKDLEKNQIRENQKTKEICTIKDYYKLDIAETPYGFEKELGNEIENKVIPILKDIRSFAKMPNDQKNRDLLFNWLAWIHLSNPKMRNFFNKTSDKLIKFRLSFTSDETLLQIFKEKGHDCSIEEIRQSLTEEKFKHDNAEFLKKIASLIPTVLNSFRLMNWTIFQAQANLEFICSDFPVVRTGHLGDENCEYFFPINKCTLLHGSYIERSKKFTLLNEDCVRKINVIFYKNAHRYVISSNKKNIEDLEKYIKHQS